MNRPTEKDPEVIAAAVDSLHGEVIEWLDSHKSTPSSPEEVAEVKSDLAEFIDADDGYDFARSLEKHKGWMPDRDLVEVLDNASTALWRAHRQLEAKWVSACGVRPLHALWDAVTYEGQPAEITKVDTVHGRYQVYVADAGHVKDGVGIHGFIVPWEEIDGTVTASGPTVSGPLFAAEAGR